MHNYIIILLISSFVTTGFIQDFFSGAQGMRRGKGSSTHKTKSLKPQQGAAGITIPPCLNLLLSDRPREYKNDHKIKPVKMLPQWGPILAAKAYQDPVVLAGYLATLQPIPESADPQEFVRGVLQLKGLRTGGATDLQMLLRMRNVLPWVGPPNEDYWPGSGHTRKFLAGLAKLRISIYPRIGARLLKIYNRLFVLNEWDSRRLPELEKSIRSLDQGPKSSDPAKMYFRLLAQRYQPVYAWGDDLHYGDEQTSWSTLAICLDMGLTFEQARLVAHYNRAVDTDETGLQDPKNPAKPLRTAATGNPETGEDPLHYNNAGPGEEDSRIAISRVCHDEAIKAGRVGLYERMLVLCGIGSHPLQDIYAHENITEVGHATTGTFPDNVAYNPINAWEAALALRAYLESIFKKIGVIAEPELRPNPQAGNRLSIEAMEGVEMAEAENAFADLPQCLRQYLAQAGLRIVVGPKGTRANQVSQLQLEHDQTSGGQSWSDVPEAYSDAEKVLFVALEDGPTFKMIRDHGLSHAFDLITLAHPEVGPMWEGFTRSRFQAHQRKHHQTVRAIREFVANYLENDIESPQMS
jgi:hypothetical protein